MSVEAEGREVPGRRRLARAVLTGVAAVGAGLVAGSARVPMAAPPGGGAGSRPTTPESALRELVAGNGRWRTYHERHPDQTRTVRRTLVAGQHPFAVVLGCVDSRVPPELVFDQGLGDLLTVRSAGEVLDEAVLGSIAYGVLELRIPLVVILGHQSCGAVAAAVRAAEGGPLLPGHMQYLVDQIRPAIDRGLRGAARIDAAITANVRLVRGRLAAEPEMAAGIAAGALAVVGARYELTSQRVRLVH
ncbi:carbonic anhydrase [Streptomyces erythrochromogenes]|uniref:Carbonic anhydrase n=1 Tax=Streptomyces erythrochromogenes TaxID=285574 RepID=A0ABZ1Q6Y4_9ACTN|nr:carbonic anhydrase [Streptomyces erythrochromogenes]MCX5582642.1 carbonic anhydrase [Streptomyces erythrochromogenes]